MGIAEADAALPAGTRVPRDEIELGDLLRARPAGWEYLQFAAELKLAMTAVENVFDDYTSGRRLPKGELVEEKKTASHLARAADDIGRLVSSFASLRRTGIQQRAFGGYGTQPDTLKIAQLARWWNSTYEGLLEWSLTIRNTRVSVRWQELLLQCAALADPPILAYRQFVEDFHARMDAAAAAHTAAATQESDIGLTLSIDKQQAGRLQADIEKTTDEYVRDLLKRHR
jgi:hypothetical protein